ncbi:helix-turn-helix domain-containing protein [Erwinia sp. 9145]|uniref:winged helix-turn-helix transcriptional regulator n=1 Tax=Erwinia sp. 9145 TaxID=1500895 RepID=UPI00054D41D8|nr:helix-turn-helix domain-containing protein [Erwinia sp. 9145]
MAWDQEAVLQFSEAICEGLSDDDDGLKRDILTHAGNRWSLGVVHLLGTRGPLRHAEIGRLLQGVTQRMLTRTLRQLERDGLIARHDFQEKRPRVVYSITDLGKELLIQMLPLWHWIIGSADRFRAARARYNE